jgi:hypothetical protein
MVIVLYKITLGMIITFIIIFHVLNTTSFQKLHNFSSLQVSYIPFFCISKLFVMCVLQYSFHTTIHQNAYGPIMISKFLNEIIYTQKAMVTMIKNASYKNDLFSIASKKLLQRVERFIFGM